MQADLRSPVLTFYLYRFGPIPIVKYQNVDADQQNPQGKEKKDPTQAIDLPDSKQHDECQYNAQNRHPAWKGPGTKEQDTT